MLSILLIGWLTITTTTGGCNVMVDEQDGISMQGKKICLEMEPGRHLVMVDKEGYYPYQETLTIDSGVNSLLTVQMKPKSKMREFSIRWVGVGAGIGSGIDLHASLFNMRIGIFSIEPCVWGLNIPFVDNLSHVKTPWLVHYNRQGDYPYIVAIPQQQLQWSYTPQFGVQIPASESIRIGISAGPQISWTKITWTERMSNGNFTSYYTFTDEPFPKSGYQFDPVWFSAQVSCIFNGITSDLITYLKYQDGIFLGVEVRY